MDVSVFCGPIKTRQRTSGRPSDWEILVPCNDGACELVWHTGRRDQFSHTLRYGELGIFPAGVAHSKRWQNDASAIVLSLNRTWVGGFGCELTSEVLIESLQRCSVRDPLIGGIVSEMERESFAESVDTSTHVAALGHCLAARVLQMMASRHKQVPTVERQLSDATIRRVTSYIEAHLGEKITVALMATQARLSPGHFSVLFKATLGTTPERYVLRARLLRAKALVETGSYTISQIAYMTGFSDHSHLTVRFKHRFGAPPKAYFPSVRII